MQLQDKELKLFVNLQECIEFPTANNLVLQGSSCIFFTVSQNIKFSISQDISALRLGPQHQVTVQIINGIAVLEIPLHEYNLES